MPKKQILIIIIISIIGIVSLPFILEIIVFRNDIYSTLSNEEWSGFLGSYIGGVLGGIGTLLAVYVTTRETRKNQQETTIRIEDEKKCNEKKERKQFADGIAEDIAIYCTDIGKYFCANCTLCRLNKKRIGLNKQFYSIQWKIKEKQNEKKKLCLEDIDKYSKIISEIEQLEQKKSETMMKLQDVKDDMEMNRSPRAIANERYFLLKIKLKNIKEGKDILNQLELMHKNSANDEIFEDHDYMDIEIEKLLNMTVRFINRYVDQKLI